MIVNRPVGNREQDHVRIQRPIKDEKGINVLLLHPDADYAYKLTNYLNGRGYSVVYASLQNAITEFKDKSIDLIIANSSFPGASAEESMAFFRCVADDYASRYKEGNPILIISDGGNPSITLEMLNNLNLTPARKVDFPAGAKRKKLIEAYGELSANIDELVQGHVSAGRDMIGRFIHDVNSWVDAGYSGEIQTNTAESQPHSFSIIPLEAEHIRGAKEYNAAPLLTGVIALIEGSTTGVSSTAGQNRYPDAQRYPDGPRAYHIKVVNEAERKFIDQCIDAGFETIVTPRAAGYYLIKGDNVGVIIRTIISANQAHVLRELANDEAYAKAADYFLQRDLDVFREWMKNPNINRAEGNISLETYYNDRINSTFSKFSGLKEISFDFMQMAEVYRSIIELLPSISDCHSPATSPWHWTRIIDAQPQNLGGLWGIFKPTAAQIKEQMLTPDGEVKKGLLAKIPLFDSQPRHGLVLEDVVHLLSAPEFKLLSQEDKQLWLSKYLIGLYGDLEDEKILAATVLQTPIVATYKGPRKMSVLIDFVSNAKLLYEKGKIKRTDYEKLLVSYEEMFEHWRGIAISSPLIAYGVASEYKPNDFLHNIKAYGKAMAEAENNQRPAYDRKTNDRLFSRLEALIKYSRGLHYVANTATEELAMLYHEIGLKRTA